MADASATQQNPLKIFVSHKQVDDQIAGQFVETLKSFGSELVDISDSRDGRQIGQSYRNWIETKLKAAEWYILIFTEPWKNWDWCLYEAGFFEASKIPADEPRIFCFHRSDVSRPSPLEKFDSIIADSAEFAEDSDGFNTDSDGVTADHKRLVRFAETYLSKVRPTFSPTDQARDAKLIASSIAKAFLARYEPIFYSKNLIFSIKNARLIVGGIIPNNTDISGDSSFMSELFGITEKNVSWAKVKNTVAGRNPLWSMQLAQAIRMAARRKVHLPVQALVECKSTGRVYRPVLHRLDERPNKTIDCEVLFIQDSTTDWERVENRKIRVLVASFHLALRTRYEIVKWLDDNLVDLAVTEPKQLRELVRGKFRDILYEAKSRGLTEPILIYECFDNPDKIKSIKNLYEEWGNETKPKLFQVIGMDPDDNVWTKFDDSEFTQGEINEISECVQKLSEINSAFLTIMLERYLELLMTGDA